MLYTQVRLTGLCVFLFHFDFVVAFTLCLYPLFFLLLFIRQRAFLLTIRAERTWQQKCWSQVLRRVTDCKRKFFVSCLLAFWFLCFLFIFVLFVFFISVSSCAPGGSWFQRAFHLEIRAERTWQQNRWSQECSEGWRTANVSSLFLVCILLSLLCRHLKVGRITCHRHGHNVWWCRSV